MDVKQLLIVGAATLAAASSRSAFSHEVGGQYARVAQIEIDPAQLENYRAQPQLIALLLVPNCGFDRTSRAIYANARHAGFHATDRPRSGIASGDNPLHD